jgi:hypothetical protein
MRADSARAPLVWRAYDPDGVPYPGWFDTEDEALSYCDKAAPVAAL